MKNGAFHQRGGSGGGTVGGNEEGKQWQGGIIGRGGEWSSPSQKNTNLCAPMNEENEASSDADPRVLL